MEEGLYVVVCVRSPFRVVSGAGAVPDVPERIVCSTTGHGEFVAADGFCHVVRTRGTRTAVCGWRGPSWIAQALAALALTVDTLCDGASSRVLSALIERPHLVAAQAVRRLPAPLQRRSVSLSVRRALGRHSAAVLDDSGALVSATSGLLGAAPTETLIALFCVAAAVDADATTLRLSGTGEGGPHALSVVRERGLRVLLLTDLPTLTAPRAVLDALPSADELAGASRGASTLLLMKGEWVYAAAPHSSLWPALRAFATAPPSEGGSLFGGAGIHREGSTVLVAHPASSTDCLGDMKQWCETVLGR